MNDVPQKQITVVIPAFNEEKTIGLVIAESKRFAGEIVVINDGSTDSTEEAALAEGATVLSHPCNLGYGSALASGFRHVKGNGARVMIVLDGDGQHDPTDIPKFVAPIVDGRADIVSGSRFIDTISKRGIPTYRRFGIGIVNHSWAIATGWPVTDTQCGFRAYSRKAVETIEITESNMSASLEILSEIQRKELKMVEVPVTVKYRGETSTIRPGTHGAQLVVYVLRKMKHDGYLTVASTVARSFRRLISSVNDAE